MAPPYMSYTTVHDLPDSTPRHLLLRPTVFLESHLAAYAVVVSDGTLAVSVVDCRYARKITLHLLFTYMYDFHTSTVSTSKYGVASLGP
jgi:hypothetical protein